MSHSKTGKNAPKDKDVKLKTSNKAEEEENFAFNPPNGGWGWFVVLGAFYLNIVVDGIQLTFGIFLKPISEEFNAEYSEVALAGSLMFGIHLLMGPICAGCNNAFGLRPVTITGSLICCFGVGISYFSTNYWFLYCSFGVVGGLGLGLVYMNSLVITSLYFTTLLPVAIAIVVCGSGVGAMVFAGLGHFLLTVTTWKYSFLMEAALAGSMSIAAIVFKPLQPVRVKISPGIPKGKTLPPTRNPKVAGESSQARRKSIYLKTEMSQRMSIISVAAAQSLAWNFAENMAAKDLLPRERKKCQWSKCCKKKKGRSMSDEYLELTEIKIDEHHRKSYVEKPQGDLTPEEIHRLGRQGGSVTYKAIYKRIDIEEEPRKKNICYTLKKALRSMINCHLLKSFDFFLFTLSGAFQVAGLLVVYTYEKDRIEHLGFSEEMSIYFVIALGGATVFWRLFLGSLALIPKLNYQAISISSIVIGGIATMGSCYYENVYFQFGFCCFFGLGLAGFAVFRVVLLVEIVGVDFVTVATGINLMFMGVASIISPPIFGYIMGCTKNYNLVFGITGFLTVISGLMLINLKKVSTLKNKDENLYS